MPITELAVENGLLKPMYVVVRVRSNALEIWLKKDPDQDGIRVMPGDRCVIPVREEIRKCFQSDGSLDYSFFNRLGLSIEPPEPATHGVRHTFIIKDGQKN